LLFYLRLHLLLNISYLMAAHIISVIFYNLLYILVYDIIIPLLLL